MKKVFPILLASAAMLTGCSKTESWSLSGEAPDGIRTVYLQAPTSAGGWYTLDSATVKNGRYTFCEPRANSQIYAVKLGENTFYVPADSTESLEMTADGHRSGSTEASLFNEVDNIFRSGGDGRDILLALDGNYSSTAAYYATRLVKDRRLLRAVANRYNEERPDDLRTILLKEELSKAMPKPKPSGEQKVIFADEIGYYDVELMDRNGKTQKLSDVVGKNPLVVLAYVDFTSSDTPAITRALGDARSAGAEIFEVGFAENQHLWANAAEGLPWPAVYQSEAADRTHINQYAVAGFPTFFIIKNGEIVERLNDFTNLAQKIRKHK